VNVVTDINAASRENRVKPIKKTACGQNAELLNIKVGGTYIYHWILKC
jgi:hypothetical protein